jgi:hypothetical protein
MQTPFQWYAKDVCTLHSRSWAKRLMNLITNSFHIDCALHPTTKQTSLSSPTARKSLRSALWSARHRLKVRPSKYTTRVSLCMSRKCILTYRRRNSSHGPCIQRSRHWWPVAMRCLTKTWRKYSDSGNSTWCTLTRWFWTACTVYKFLQDIACIVNVDAYSGFRRNSSFVPIWHWRMEPWPSSQS